MEAAKPKKRQQKELRGGKPGKAGAREEREEEEEEPDQGAETGFARSVQLSGLPGSVTTEEVQAWVQERMPGKCDIAYVTKDKDGAKDGKGSKSSVVDFVVAFRKAGTARRALEELQGQALSGHSVSASLRTLQLSRKTEKAGRLIVRNLNFSATEKQLRKAFGKVGKLVDVTLPAKPGAAAGVNRGFGFVQYADLATAERAMAELNGVKVCGRGVAVDWAVDARAYSSLQHDESAAADAEDALEPRRKPAKVAAPDDDDEDDDAKKADEEDEEDDEDDEDDEDAEKPGGSAGIDDEAKRMRALAGEFTSEKGAEEVEGKTAAASAAKAKEDVKRKVGFDVDEGTTVFVRNVPFETTEEELKEVFRRYGVVKSIKLPKDPKGQQAHRGSAFVKFRDAAGSDAVLEAEAAADRKLKEMSAVARKSDQRELPAVEGFGISLKGRRLVVKKALTPKELEETAENRKPEKGAAKKQRMQWMHLLNVGRIDEHSGDKWKLLSKSEQKQRAASMKERKWRANNTNFTIDPRRLSVRNLPLSVDANRLRLAITQKLMESSNAEGQKKRDLRAQTQARIKSVNLVRDSERRSTEDNSRRSRGFGFITFEDHTSAMRTLEYLNDNPKVFGGSRRPIVEFALEDKRKLRMQQEMFQKHGHKLLKPKEGAEGEGEAGDAAPTSRKAKRKQGESRGRKQREKRRVEKALAASKAELRAVSLDEKRARRAAKSEEARISRPATKRKMREQPDAGLPKTQRGGDLRPGHLPDDFELRALERFRQGGK